MTHTTSLRTSEDNYCCYRRITSDQVRLIWEITNRCPLDCVHCFVDTADRSPLLTTEECFRIIDGFASFPIAKVMFTGGEPFTRPDLLSLIARAKAVKPGIIVDITTNLELVDEGVVAELARLGVDEITTSLDGHAELHDAIRRKPGNFANAMDKVRLLRAAGIEVDAVTVLNKLNYRSLDTIVASALGNGFSSLNISGLIARGGSVRDLRDLALGPAELAWLGADVAQRRKELGARLPIRTVALFERLHGGACPIGNIVSIDYRGGIRRCLLTSCPDSRAFNVRADRLCDVYTCFGNTRCEME